MRVMTFNIRGGLGMDGRRDTGRIADLVRAWSPDIVCFQEVHQRLPWSGWVDQPGLLRRGLGMPLLFQRNVNTLIGGYGLAVASHYALRDVARGFLPGRGERRGALAVTAQTPQGTVRVWCTHWGLRGEERVRQASRLAGWINAAGGPALVCGDFNECAGGPALRRLRDEARLTDTGIGGDIPTYPADTPTARIDGILCSAVLRPRLCVVPDTRVSDHRPVVCDFD